MTFADFMFGVVGTAFLLVLAFIGMYDREHPKLSFLLAGVFVVFIVMPLLYLFVHYFGGYV